MQGGLTCTTIYYNIKKYCRPNMAAMEKEAGNGYLDPVAAILLTWHPTDCFFIQAASFLKNIKRPHSFLGMVPGPSP